MDRRRLLERLRSGHLHNVPFADFCRLIEAFGFELRRVKGSHHQFLRTGIPEVLTVQPDRGRAKHYQLRKLLELVDRYNLTLEDER